MKKINAYLKLMRPEVLLAGFAVTIGQAVALGALPPLKEAVLGYFTGLFISSAATVFNDYFDIQVDRANRINRPLVTGEVSKPEAIGLGVLLSILGFASSAVLGTYAFATCVMIWVIAFLYNWKLKGILIIGNLLVSTCIGAVFLFAAFSVNAKIGTLVMFVAVLCGLANFGVEVSASALDLKGDKKRNSNSIAVRFGKAKALQIAGGIFLLYACGTFVPVIIGWFGWKYLLLMLGSNAIVGYYFFKVYNCKNSEEGRIYLSRLWMVGFTAAFLTILISVMYSL
ncbi:MAG: UbiA family prenyltransferase [Candidatus Micrarchaeia archaeon]|jgi:geranylgeranylglycerol-phosphate geranylgeranyltransferase